LSNKNLNTQDLASVKEKIEGLGTYDVVQAEDLPEIDGYGMVLSHKKTKARIVIIGNSDENKVFNIGFRTPPTNSKGIQHIIEHTVLCGSDKYPVKDPFVELAKGSLNTFLNAMTYSDKTVYPVASCNDKDFQNLVDVYLDAVFHPNIYKYEEIFKQEGWHYELTEKSGPLTINGVVYNEMRGVYSSEDSAIARTVSEALYPDTVYRHDSGGIPEEVPNLTREEYLEYHATYYHPSNSYIYFYGNMDMEEKLRYLDEEYLSQYEYLYVESCIPVQAAFEKPIYAEGEYAIAENDTLEDNTFLSYNAIIGTTTETLLTTGIDVLNYILMEAPGAPLHKAIIDAGFCADVESQYDTSIYQPSFSIVARNANAENEKEFLEIIENTLKKIVAEGIEERTIIAAINRFEFRHKEGDFGRYPKGLMYGLDCMETWLYDDESALDVFKFNPVFEELKRRAKTGYFEELIQTYLLDNPTKVYAKILPKYGINAVKDEILAEKLEAYRKTLSDEELEAIIADTEHLKKYQSEPSPAEDLAKIPLLKLEDISKEARKLNNIEEAIDDVKVVRHDVFTNGIEYVKFHFSINDLTARELQIVSLITDLLKYVDTDNYTVDRLNDEINIETGGIGFGIGLIPDYEEDSYEMYFGARIKCFEDKLGAAVALLEEILLRSHITDRKKMKETISELRASEKSGLLASGHLTAAGRAKAYISKTAAVKECINGVDYYRFLEDLDKNFDERYEGLADEVQAVYQKMARRSTLILSYTSKNESSKLLNPAVEDLLGKLNKDEPAAPKEVMPLGIQNEGFRASSKVQYVATAGNFIVRPDGTKTGYQYTGALSVLGVIFSYDYLWINVRVKGGAYGAMCDFSREGFGTMMSYRDPNLLETFEIYKKAAEYVRAFDASDRDMLKYIIGAIAKMDVPLTPQAEGEMSFIGYMAGASDALRQQTRDEVLSTDQEKIRNLAPLLEEIMNYGIISAVGDEARINADAAAFKNVVNLIS